MAVVDESELFIRSCMLIPVVLTAYDTLLTFSREVDCIWRRKTSTVTILYCLQRYCVLLAAATRLARPTSLTGCKATVYIVYVADVLAMFGVALFSTLRTWAISGKITIPVLLVFVCSMFSPCANIYNYGRPQYTIFVNGGCETHLKDGAPPTGPLPIVTRVSAIVTDLLVLIITWRKSGDAWRTSVRIRQFKPKLSILVLRDGAIYFFVLFILNFISLLLDVFARNSYYGSTTFVFVSEAVAPTLIARFILDLRSIYRTNPSRTTDSISTVDLSSSAFIGDLGASIDQQSTWLTGPGDDVAAQQQRAKRQSRVPFQVGLIYGGHEHAGVPLEDMRNNRSTGGGSRQNPNSSRRGGPHRGLPLAVLSFL